VLSDQVDECEGADHDAVLQNTEQPGYYNEVDQAQTVSEALPEKHPSSILSERALRQ
jgi:hypothetical protein